MDVQTVIDGLLKHCANDRPAGHLWTDIGDSCDQRYAEFCDIYLRANSNERRDVRKRGEAVDAFRLIIFCRRCGLLAQSPSDTRPFAHGLTAAWLAHDRTDVPDTLVSLTLLRVSARRLGVDIATVAEQCAFEETDEWRRIMKTILLDSPEEEDKIQLIVQEFGPKPWIGESIRRYGDMNAKLFGRTPTVWQRLRRYFG